MTRTLNDIEDGIQPEMPRILLYGVEGIGKTSFAADAPNVIFTRTEDRHAHIKAKKFPLAKTFDAALEDLELLAKSDHTYQFHVTDSVDWLEKLIHAKLCSDYGEQSIIANDKGSPFAFGRGMALAEEEFKQYLKRLSFLHKKKNMGIIFIAHSTIKRFEDPMRASYDQYRPALQDRILSIITQWVDCVFFANYHIGIKEEKAGFGKVENKAVGNGERVIYTEQRPGFEAKNSYNLPDVMPLNFAEFWTAYNDFIGHTTAPQTTEAGNGKTKRK